MIRCITCTNGERCFDEVCINSGVCTLPGMEQEEQDPMEQTNSGASFERSMDYLEEQEQKMALEQKRSLEDSLTGAQKWNRS